MKPSRSRLVVLVVCLLAIGAVVPMGVAPVAAADVGSHPGHAGAQDRGTSGHVAACAVEPPDDHADPEGNTSEVIGWVDGFWYNEPVEIADPEALTEEELEQLTARTAARVEALRCLTFEEVPPIEFFTREEHFQRLEASVEDDVTEADRAFSNAQFAAMFFVGQDEDAIEVWMETRAAAPIAFYNVEDEFIGFITDDPDSVEIDQVTLAHELLHALQDEHFDLDAVFEEETTDGFMSSLAVVEGEAVLLDGKYEDNCEAGAWVDECITVDPAPGEPPHWGLTLEFLAAYHSPLVAYTYENEGWEGVDAIHEQMPDSMVEVLVPAEYGVFERAPIVVEDRSGDDWERVVREDDLEYDIAGQHALTAMLVAPNYEAGEQRAVVDLGPFLQGHVGGVVDYNHPATSGWQADKLVAYQRDDGQLASVWKLAWSDAQEATAFAEAYERLIEFRGGERVEGYANVYTLDGVGGYDMAVGVEQDGDRVWIVTAPSVEELTDVHADFAFAEPGPAAFEITRISPDELEVEPGEVVEIHATIDNVGDRTGEQTVVAEFDGVAVDERTVTIDANGWERVTFAFDTDGHPAGSFTLQVVTEDATETVSITILETADEDDTIADDAPADDADDDIPGFGVAVALAAILASLLVLRRWH